MNQQRMGQFLKQLRKDKGLTQEQLAEHFNVSSRTVSRWETGSNMPDANILIELAEFYDMDIREIIDSKRKSENMNNGTKDALKKVAEYSNKLLIRNIISGVFKGIAIFLVVYLIINI
ncbi:MAG: helix-turn-helix transcriptional regulator [Oscillospiraceae bacterium]|nr:helix-turn-helix transcriptional regulator [Oscillospiraceae bacterium]